jgi:hypothetical protein
LAAVVVVVVAAVAAHGTETLGRFDARRSLPLPSS